MSLIDAIRRTKRLHEHLSAMSDFSTPEEDDALAQVIDAAEQLAEQRGPTPREDDQ